MSDLIERPNFDDLHRQMEEFAERAGDDILYWKHRALEAEAQIAAKDAALVEARGLFEAIMFHIDEHSFSLAKGLAAQGIHGLNAALSLAPAQIAAKEDTP